jgi:hypothetical protein
VAPTTVTSWRAWSRRIGPTSWTGVVGRVGRAVMAERDAHAGEQLAHAEGLGQVVVGASVEGRDLVVLGAPRRQHDDRDLRPPAQATDQVDAVAVGQAEVEEHQVRGVLGDRVRGLGESRDLDDAEVVAGRVERRNRRICSSSSTSRARARRGSGGARSSHRLLAAKGPGASACGQADAEAGAAAGRGVGGDRAAVGLDDAATDGEAEADAGDAGAGGAEELLEHAGLAARRQVRRRGRGR